MEQTMRFFYFSLRVLIGQWLNWYNSAEKKIPGTCKFLPEKVLRSSTQLPHQVTVSGKDLLRFQQLPKMNYTSLPSIVSSTHFRKP